MNITPLPAAPDPYNDTTEEFNNKAVAFVAAQQAMVPELNSKLSDFAANLTTLAAGGGFSLSYNVDTSSTATAYPGSGIMRFNYAYQSSATQLILAHDVAGLGAGFIIDQFATSTSTIKGQLRLQQLNDVSKWILYNVTAVSSGSDSNGFYRVVTVSLVASSQTSPFSNGATLVLQFTSKGDKGDIGPQGQGFQNMLVFRTTQTWTPPAGITKARITVIDGGQGGGTSSTIDFASAGKGGDSSISVRTVSSSTTYTATVGAGGAGGTGSNSTGSSGGASSFSGVGITTLTSSNGDINVPGGQPASAATSTYPSAQSAGTSLYALTISAGAASATSIGQGGPAQIAGPSAGKSGAAGAVIIEY